MELEFLRTEVTKLKAQVGEVTFSNLSNLQDDEDHASEHESNPSDEDEYIDDLPQVINNNKGKGPRTSVSAEVFGAWNKKGDFKAPVYPKPP
jgi:hypothetical protein